MAKSSLHSDVRTHILQTAQPIISGKGYSAVGLNEILQASGVPKGSFYHYFGSKDAFGQALLEHYFEHYQLDLDALLQPPAMPAGHRLMQYWTRWLELEVNGDCKGRCLAVKLAAEVSDLSEAMRAVLQRGTQQIIARLAGCISEGLEDHSLPPLRLGHPELTATTLYQLWLGASLRSKITRNREPADAAMTATRRLLGLEPCPR
ncbi:TetR/AcrR family transcriptional regulator [Frateuria aurantia]|uniref:Transcriptional regulator n=1 Tax=Frateuria aurantia (strain ATCC 33424 / DSM 6220 / KCTC 2777 / LMG 1558 / NBRC 3245 / NCIMB 13370) TaxID=767434 RepID=H8L029_FRAAD|nr:TetR/AcrR family transcriptional regulator [Frateuria aurantia]AFC86241.1 transcriptional regulator [Frateuria aurantia DSM 6220]